MSTAVFFVAPFFIRTTLRFVEAFADTPGVELGLISQDPLERLPPPLASKLAAHWRVADALDPVQIHSAVRGLSERIGPPARLLAVLEQLQVPLAEVREALGIEGMGAETAQNFRDKARMKQVLREAGIPCARHCLAHEPDAALGFARSVGYPLIVKPPAGSGAQDTFRIGNDAALAEAIGLVRPSAERPMLLEEFITGDEHSFDTVSIRGQHVWHSLSRYYPTPLEVVENRWIQWCVLLPREVDAPVYDDIREVAFGALDALGMGTGLSHMEWFRRRDGSIAVSEVGARPPGAQFTTLIGYAHEIDLYRVWANLMAHETFTPPVRHYAAGIAFLRGQGDGRVKAIHGLDQAQAEIGNLVIEVKLPQAGEPHSLAYEGDGYVILRHPDTAVVERALARVVSLVRVELG